MKYTHQLTLEDDDFLQQDRTDPITGEKIEEGHTVVICAACKSAFFIESWEYLGDSHCDQNNTLESLPKSQNLYLQANIKYTREILTFGFAKKPMFKTSKGGFVAFIFAGVVSILFGLFGAFIGLLTGDSFLGLFIFAVCLGILSILIFVFTAIISVVKPNKTKNKSIKQIENMNTNFSIYIDYKERGLVIQEKKDIVLTPFAEIERFKYDIMYHPSSDIDALFCQLQIQITTKDETMDYFATIHRDTIPEWSTFISKLPILRQIYISTIYEF